MSQILDVIKRKGEDHSYWLILSCEHWFKWSADHPPKVGDEFNCEKDKPLPPLKPRL